MSSSLLQVVRFGSIGLLATAVHYLVALVVIIVCGPYLANFVGYCTAVLVSYIGHQRFTFMIPREDRAHRRHFPRFIAASLLALAISQAVLASALAFGVWEKVALVIAVLAVPPVTFLLSRYWVYK